MKTSDNQDIIQTDLDSVTKLVRNIAKQIKRKSNAISENEIVEIINEELLYRDMAETIIYINSTIEQNQELDNNNWYSVAIHIDDLQSIQDIIKDLRNDK